MSIAHTWLTAALAGTAVMGLGFVALPHVTLGFFDWLLFGGVEASPLIAPAARAYAAFIGQVLGAVLAGWAVLLICLVRMPDAPDPGWRWRAFALSFGGWFIVDTTASLATGFWQNAVFNLCFAVLIVPPLAVLLRRT